MSKGNKIVISNNGEKIQKAANLITDANDVIDGVKKNIKSKSEKASTNAITVTGYINAAYNVLIRTLEKESKLLEETSGVLKDDKKKLVSVDSIKTKISVNLKNNNLKNLQKNYSSLVGIIGAKKAKSWVKGLKLGSVTFSKNAKSILSLKNKPTKNKNNSKTTKKTTSSASTVTTSNSSNKSTSKSTASKTTKKSTSKTVTLASIKKTLKTSLKNGELSSAASIYGLLVTAMGAKKAKKYLNGLGYKAVKNKNGATVIKKIKNTSSSKNSNSKDKVTNTSSSNSNDSTNGDDSNDLNEETSDKDSEDNSEQEISEGTPTDIEESEESIEENQPSESSVATPVEEEISDNEENNTTYNSYTVSDNTNDTVSNVVEENSTSDEVIPESTDVTEDIVRDDSKTVTSTKKVKTLDTDSSDTDSKSSGGVGTVIPIGLGVAAVGAAAVAGTRYLKNRKNSSYDEEYDDENNNLDSNITYTDSAEYDGSGYMSDDYLGPAGSSYTDFEDLDDSEDTNKAINYIDSEALEEDIANDNDLVLRDLGSNEE